MESSAFLRSALLSFLPHVRARLTTGPVPFVRALRWLVREGLLFLSVQISSPGPPFPSHARCGH